MRDTSAAWSDKLYVNVVNKATPKVAVNPGKAPKTIPNNVLPKRRSTSVGLEMMLKTLEKKISN